MNKKLLSVFLLVFSCSLFAFGESYDTVSYDTSMFRANLQRTGEYKTKGGSQLTGLLWKFKTGGGILSSPAVADGVVYVGSLGNYLYAVDAKSGQQKWKFKTNDKIYSSPAVADGVVYFGSCDTYLYAVK